MSLLAEPDVVTDLLPQYSIPATQLDAAMRMVAGWLSLDAGLDAPPEALADGDDLFSAAFELVVLLVTNPELLAQKSAGPTSRSWPQAQRRSPDSSPSASRDAIRAEVRKRAGRAAAGPRGSFPDPRPWPDPVCP